MPSQWVRALGSSNSAWQVPEVEVRGREIEIRNDVGMAIQCSRSSML